MSTTKHKIRNLSWATDKRNRRKLSRLLTEKKKTFMKRRKKIMATNKRNRNLSDLRKDAKHERTECNGVVWGNMFE